MWRPRARGHRHPAIRHPSFRRRAASRTKPRFEALPDQLPPQNPWSGRVGAGTHPARPPCPSGASPTVLRPDAFYLNAHRGDYRTALMLHGQGKPHRPHGHGAWLADTGQLEKVAAATGW